MHAMEFSPLLRRALLADAVTSAAMGLLLSAAAGPLAGPLGLPVGLLRGAGLILLPFAAAVALIGTRVWPSRAAVWTVIAANLLWTLDSLLLPLSGWIRPTGLGQAFILAQAVAVAALAGAQWMGLRQSTPAMA